MSHHYDRTLSFEFIQNLPEFSLEFHIESAHGLIEEQDLRRVNERNHESTFAFHSYWESAIEWVLVMEQSYFPEKLLLCLSSFMLVNTFVVESEKEIE